MNDKELMKTSNEIRDCLDRYRSISGSLIDAAEYLHSVWGDEAGDAFYRQSVELADEMKKNVERMKQCCGSL